jgi:hypothetical protein
VVEPVDPLERVELDVVDPLPRPMPADQLGLVGSDDRLGQSVDAPISVKRSRSELRAVRGVDA